MTIFTVLQWNGFTYVSPKETKGESDIHSYMKEEIFYLQAHMCASTDMRQREAEDRQTDVIIVLCIVVILSGLQVQVKVVGQESTCIWTQTRTHKHTHTCAHNDSLSQRTRTMQYSWRLMLHAEWSFTTENAWNSSASLYQIEIHRGKTTAWLGRRHGAGLRMHVAYLNLD